MTDNNVIKLAQPGTFVDSLTENLRSGARALLTQAVEGGGGGLSAPASRSQDRGGPRSSCATGICPARDYDWHWSVGVRQPGYATASARRAHPFNPTILPPT